MHEASSKPRTSKPPGPRAARSDARCQPSARAKRLTQRCQQVALDGFEKDARDCVFLVVELFEDVALENQQQRPLPGDRGDGRRLVVDQGLVAERLAGTSEADADSPIASHQYFLDRAVDREEVGRRRSPFGDNGLARGAADVLA